MISPLVWRLRNPLNNSDVIPAKLAIPPKADQPLTLKLAPAGIFDPLFVSLLARRFSGFLCRLRLALCRGAATKNRIAYH
jgi:hypothetical protein